MDAQRVMQVDQLILGGQGQRLFTRQAQSLADLGILGQDHVRPELGRNLASA